MLSNSSTIKFLVVLIVASSVFILYFGIQLQNNFKISTFKSRLFIRNKNKKSLESQKLEELRIYHSFQTFATKTFKTKAFPRNCTIWNKPKHWKSSKPTFVLDPNRFLYPGLYGGPNNQIIGLWQSVYVAIKLNRTLVLPRFRSHHTNGENILSPFQMIDVKRLCRYVSCIHVMKMSQLCDGSFDVILQGMNITRQWLKRFEQESGMSILHHHKKSTVEKGRRNNPKLKGSSALPNVLLLPNDTSIILERKAWLNSDSLTLNKTYGTKRRCAIFAAPFYTLRYKKHTFRLATHDARNVSDKELMASVIDTIRRPTYITNLAKSYINTVLGGQQFVGVHWRYVLLKDWENRCKRTQLLKFDSTDRRICNVLLAATATDVAKAIKNVMSNILPIDKGETKPAIVYISTPPGLSNFKEEIYDKIQRGNDSFKKPTVNLKIYLSDNLKTCQKTSPWKNFSEVLSLVEMEIMRLSTWFLYSENSSWSKNVRLLRGNFEKNKKARKKSKIKKKRKFEASILKHVQDQVLSRRKGLPLFAWHE